MSKPHDEHQSPIKTPKQLIAVVVASFVVPVILIILLVNWVMGAKLEPAGTDAYSEKAIAQRIAPVAKLDFKDPNAVKVLKTGEQVYQAACTACHAAGAAGAPKSGDVAAWAPRLKLGLDALTKSVITGKGAMPARAGNPDLDDIEIARAVVYMANNAGGKFAEPATPAAPAAQAAAPAAASPAAVAPAAAAAPAPQAAAGAAAAVAVAAAPATNVDAAAGKKLYDSICMVCHVAAVAGAPKFGDKAAWAPRGTNLDALTATVIKGKGAMPPKGGAGNASDAEIKAAVAYMLAAVT
ncbi:MAG: c-type cytochrome [Burkholderiaceae bacterium]